MASRKPRRQQPSSAKKFKPSQRAERQYERQLRKVARTVGSIIEPYVEGAAIPQLDRLLRALADYSDTLGPWATRVADDMLRAVDMKDKAAFRATSRRLTQGMNSLLADSAAGREAARLQNEQVTLIKSLPLKAGERAQELARYGMVGSRRADDIAKDLQNIGQVTESRAVLIARTETAKANSTLTQARATAVGADSYIWRTAGDADVRESHAEMEGRVVRWDDPPTLSDGTTTHAGQIYNCRCWAEPIFTDLIDE
jgi:SPP1 gp7 family putative phage head morphogenesis protein